MTTTSVLHQTLRDLCRDAWCYAVFWKLKRQSRMVLAWEDAFYEQSKTRELCGSHPNPSPVDVRVSSSEISNVEDPIGLSVAKMSYHIYSVGEGIIGKVAFTNKHQWVFSSSNKAVVATGIVNRKGSMRSQPDKYPAGWDHQFAAGINTIAVIAVPQGVVQLGSTQTIPEDMKLVAHVKALFGTLQNIPGVYPSDLVTEVQTLYPMSPQMHHGNISRVGVTGNALVRTQPMAVTVSGVGVTGVEALGGTIGHSTVGRVPLLFNSCSQTQPQLLPVVIGMPGGPIQRPHCASSYMSARDSGHQTPTTISKSPNVDLGLQRLHPSGKNLSVDLGHQEPIAIGKNQNIELPGLTPALVDKNPKVELFRQTPNPNIWAHRVGMGCMKATVTPRLGIISKFSLTTDHIVEAKNTSCLPSVTSAKYSSMEMPDSRVSDKIEVPAKMGVSHVLGKTNSPTGTMFPSLEKSTYISSRVKPPPGSKSTVKDCQVVGASKSLVEDREVVSRVEHVAGRPLLTVPRPLSDRFPKKVQEPICYSPQVDKPVADFINSRHSKNSADGKTLGDYHVSRRLDSEQHLLDVSQTVDNREKRFSGNLLHLSQFSRNLKVDVERPNVSDCEASSERKRKQLFCGHPSTGGMQLLARHSVLTTAIGHQTLEDKRHLLASVDKYQTDNNRNLICKHQSSVGGQLLKPSHQIVCTESCEISHPVTLRCSEVDSVPVDTKVSALYKSGVIVNPESTSSNSVESRVATHPYKGFQPLDAANSSICSDGQTSHMLQLSEISEHGFTDSSTVTTGLDDTLFCEGFMDDWNSVTVPIRDVDFSASQYLSGGDGDGEQNAFKTELEDFEKFLASLTNENEDKNELNSDAGANGTCTFPNKETLACMVGCNSQKGGHVDCSTEVQTTQEGFNRLQQAVIPVPPLHNQGKTRRQLKRVFSGGDIMAQQEERQKIHKCLLELQNIIPGGGNYTIDALLDKTTKYADFLQKTLHDSGNQTQTNKWQKGGDRIGVTERGVEDKGINASWVMELNQEGNCCPIIVEDLAQPQHMLVEMVCERTGTIKEIKRCFKKLHVVILKDIMEARNSRIWARFVVEAPQDVNRIQVLWSLMQLLEPK